MAMYLLQNERKNTILFFQKMMILTQIFRGYHGVYKGLGGRPLPVKSYPRKRQRFHFGTRPRLLLCMVTKRCWAAGRGKSRAVNKGVVFDGKAVAWSFYRGDDLWWCLRTSSNSRWCFVSLCTVVLGFVFRDLYFINFGNPKKHGWNTCFMLFMSIQ